MIGLFRRKPKVRPYPAVYGEWCTEFGRIDNSGRALTEAEAVLLSGGVLQDSKYTKESFTQSLAAFLERQVGLFFKSYDAAIKVCMDDGDVHYLVLTLKRYTRRYEQLFFFEKLEFMSRDEREQLTCDLQDKLKTYHKDLLAYVQKISEYTPHMIPVITHIRRLI